LVVSAWQRWSEEERAFILAGAMAPGAIASHVARRFGVITGQFYTWHKAIPLRSAPFGVPPELAKANFAEARLSALPPKPTPPSLPLAKQAKALSISRGTLYYVSRPVPAADLALMRRIDELHLEYPFAGSRMMQGPLKREGFSVGRLHVATLMKRMGIAAIYRRPNTSKPDPGHKIYPYLLRNVPILRPDQVWAMDITYIPMARGFAFLAAFIDWFSRKVLAWRLSITLDTGFCIEAVEEALAK
jgi:transposase-like protein